MSEIKVSRPEAEISLLQALRMHPISEVAGMPFGIIPHNERA